MINLPDMDDCETFNESQTLKYVSDLIKNLGEAETSLDMQIVSDLILRLSTTYFDFDKYLDKVCEMFINKNVLKSVYHLLVTLSHTCKIGNESLNLLYTFLINFTDYSEMFAKFVLESGIINFVIDTCLNKTILNEKDEKNINELLENAVKLVNNVVRDPINNITHKLLEFKLILVEIIKLNDENMLAVLSMLTLAYLVNDDEVHLLDEGSNTIEVLLRKMKYVLEKNIRSSGFSILELINGIRYISSNDKMKQKIYDCGGIPLFINILKSNNHKEIEATLNTIWNLCFIRTIKNVLINEYEIETVILPFKNHECGKIKKNYEGILWEIKNKMEYIDRDKSTKCLKSPTNSSFDVFISYAWPNKKQILEIREHLDRFNIRVWLDEDQMIGSVLEAMASGIENSSLVIIGMSTSYMKSPNCRSEAEYAYYIKKPIIPLIMELKYKPTSWLGIIMGSKVYYEFSERRKPDEVVVQLVKSIKYSLNSENSEPMNEIESQPIKINDKLENSQSISNNIKVSKTIINWNCSQVVKWLTKWKLDHIKKRFSEVDGSLLLVMIDIRSKSPEYFNNSLKSEYGMKFIDVLKFHRALNELISI